MSRQNCKEFEDALREVVENRLDADGALRVHAEQCPECAFRLAEDALLSRAVTAWNRAVPVVSLVDGVESRWNAERRVTEVADETPKSVPATRESHSSPVTVAIIDSPVNTGGWSMPATIAAAAAMLAFAMFLPGGSEDKSDEKLITNVSTPAVAPAKTTDVVDSGESVNVDRLVAGLQTRYAGLSRNVNDTVSGLQWEIPNLSFEVAPGFSGNAEPNPKQPAKTRPWSDGLQPVGRDVRKAFSFLKNAIPVSTAGVGS